MFKPILQLMLEITVYKTKPPSNVLFYNTVKRAGCTLSLLGCFLVAEKSFCCSPTQQQKLFYPIPL